MTRWLALLLALGACGGDLAPPELIADLRVLALRADPPAGAPGTEVALDALVVAPDPAPALARAWVACVPAGGGQVGPAECARAPLPAASCADLPESDACLLGGGETARYRLPAKALEGRPAGTSGQVYIVLLVTDGAVGVADCARALAERGEVPAGCRVAAKRVVVSASAPAAAVNPTVSAPAVNGEEVAVTVPGVDPAAADPPFLSWFVTAGELDDFRTDAVGSGLTNRWTPAGAAGRIYVVVRDGQGGEGWASATR